jgi:hypothetical protein
LKNKLGADLAQTIIDAAAQAGFIKIVDGVPIATGEDGLLGYLRWLALYERRTYAGLLGRVLPYQVQDLTPEHRVLSRQEVEEELKRVGCPPSCWQCCGPLLHRLILTRTNATHRADRLIEHERGGPARRQVGKWYGRPAFLAHVLTLPRVSHFRARAVFFGLVEF